MKKIKNSKLSLSTETIKLLGEPQLREVPGGATRGCTDTICVTVWTCGAGCQTNQPTCATCFC